MFQSHCLDSCGRPRRWVTGPQLCLPPWLAAGRGGNQNWEKGREDLSGLCRVLEKTSGERHPKVSMAVLVTYHSDLWLPHFPAAGSQMEAVQLPCLTGSDAPLRSARKPGHAGPCFGAALQLLLRAAVSRSFLKPKPFDLSSLRGSR